jgi:hypothetical protein
MTNPTLLLSSGCRDGAVRGSLGISTRISSAGLPEDVGKHHQQDHVQSDQKFVPPEGK